MASTIKQKVESFVNEKILSQNLEFIVGEAFGRYSKYIIQDRALPDVRDGLKPVQRRILFAMNQLGMGSDKPYKKSARIVGEVIGKYHPHGDSSVYEAMVRMSQTWKMGALLIDMHGNNGSLDGDPAAAMRYTEARLTFAAEALLQDIDKKTVAFVPNFDDEEYEPVVLPAKYPNLLVNGAMGMATGYATNIPPHNLNEVVDATIYRIDHPASTADDLAKWIHGPDFPTGGIVEGGDEIRKAFQTGRGRIVLKGKVEIKDGALIVTEIPYEINKADLVRKIDDIRLKKKIDGINEVRDESDREGLRIVIDIAKGMNADTILAYLMKNTELSVSYSYNMVAIIHRSPKLLSLPQIIDSYIEHQKEVVRNRSNYEMIKAEKRRHIVEGFLRMVDVLDEVIALIRAAAGKKASMDALMKTFAFSEAQAEAIVTLQLYRLSSTDVQEMQKENFDLQKQIVTLSKILRNESELENVIKKELAEINQKFPTPRKSVIMDEIAKVQIDVQDLIQHESVMVGLTKDGYLKRSSIKSYLATNGDIGLKPDDYLIRCKETSTKSTLLIFTDYSHYMAVPVYKIPDRKWKEMGDYVGSYAPLEGGETVMECLYIDDFTTDQTLLLATREGMIKTVPLAECVNSRQNRTYEAIPAKKTNPLVAVDLSQNSDLDVVCVSRNGYVLKYPLAEVPLLSLSAKGVKAMTLREDALVAAMLVSRISKDEVLLFTNRGGLKREYVSNIEPGHRPAKGKTYLRSVKTNPYEFVGAQSVNVFRLKDDITIRLALEKSALVIPGNDLKVDKYEHGIPYVEKEQGPIGIYIDEANAKANQAILDKLHQEIVPIKAQTPPVDEIVIPAAPTESEAEDVMSDLEKIINVSREQAEKAKREKEDEEEAERLIQQTLF